MKALIDKYEYKLEIIETNHKTIEATRKELKDEIERNLRSERRFAVLQKDDNSGSLSISDLVNKFVEFLPLIMKLSGNPAILSAGEAASALNGLKNANNGNPDRSVDAVQEIIDGMVQQ